jgi:ADP-ribose pyrophosphatase YjhB (NUDIX family)
MARRPRRRGGKYAQMFRSSIQQPIGPIGLAVWQGLEIADDPNGVAEAGASAEQPAHLRIERETSHRAQTEGSTFVSTRRRYAALPYRPVPEGDWEVLLITTKGSQRWIIPKGRPMRRRRPHKAAAQEAIEEAGVHGRASPVSIGEFKLASCFAGRGPPGGQQVTVFPLLVERCDDDWQEKGARERRWLRLQQAASTVHPPGLRSLIERLPRLLAGRDQDEEGKEHSSARVVDRALKEE